MELPSLVEYQLLKATPLKMYFANNRRLMLFIVEKTSTSKANKRGKGAIESVVERQALKHEVDGTDSSLLLQPKLN